MIESISPERHMVPRWRVSAVSIMSGETAPVKSVTSRTWLADESELEASLAAWTRRPLPSRAVDLITAAVLFRCPEAGREAAQFLLEESASGALPKVLANKLLAELNVPTTAPTDLCHSDVGDVVDEGTIRQLRKALRRNPHNPLGWADLAHAHASYGNLEAATRAMRIALASNPDNRVILRSASRLYVHREEPSTAHRLLYEAESVRSDPWLLAAELATASLAERTSKLTRLAKRMVEDASLGLFHKAELAGALATLELEAGSHRAARKLFRLSLEDPTDNSVAQAQWASRRFTEFVVPRANLNILRGYEARARRAMVEQDWSQAVSEAWSWLEDEPFSSHPAIFGSYTASVGSLNFPDAIRFAEAGLRANPSNQMLLNNLVFALAHDAQLEKAERYFQRIGRPRDDGMKIPLLATEGLLHYRRGNAERGRALYKEAIEMARSVRNWKAVVLAWTFFAHEELLTGTPKTAFIREALQTAKRREPLPELAVWLERLKGH